MAPSADCKVREDNAPEKRYALCFSEHEIMTLVALCSGMNKMMTGVAFNVSESKRLYDIMNTDYAYWPEGGRKSDDSNPGYTPTLSLQPTIQDLQHAIENVIENPLEN